jgi:hypothetical protein
MNLTSWLAGFTIGPVVLLVGGEPDRGDII